MVHFGSKLEANKVLEWRKHYLDYKKLKKLIKSIAGHLNVVKIVPDKSRSISYAFANGDDSDESESALLTYPKKDYGSIDIENTLNEVEELDNEFVPMFQEECLKVEKFYKTMFDKFVVAYDDIKHTIDVIKSNGILMNALEDKGKNAKVSKTLLSIESIRSVSIDLYRKMNYLLNFTILNYTACVKICKKHDKATGIKKATELMKFVNQQHFVGADELLELMKNVESLFADTFSHGDRTIAKSELLVKHRPRTDWAMMHLGFRYGVVTMLIVWTIWDVGIIPSTKPYLHNLSAFPHAVNRVYRCYFYFVVFFWLWALVLQVIVNARVNYIYLFEFDPRRTTHYTDILMQATTITMVYFANMLMYMKVFRGQIPVIPGKFAILFPLMFLCYMIATALFPYKDRSLAFAAIKQLVISPFGEVTFWTAYVGQWKLFFDEASYMSEPADNTCTDRNYIFSRYLSPALISMPLFWRFGQNLRRYHDTKQRWPHLVNALKYSIAFLVIVTATFHPEYLDADKDDSGDKAKIVAYKVVFYVLLVVSTLFTFIWDVTMDWGLARPKYKFLRGTRMYRHRRYYYILMVLDFFLRYIWVLTLIPSHVFFSLASSNGGKPETVVEHPLAQYLVPLFAVSEMIRRAMWSTVRIEYEHLHNTQGYRRVEFIPLHFESPVEELPQEKQKYNLATIYFEVFAFIAIVTGVTALSVFANPPTD